MEGSQESERGFTDDLIVDADKVHLIEDNKDRLEQNFRVHLAYGLKATDSVTPKQWILLKGEAEDRNYAKNYMRALCNAEEKLCIQYPVELHSILTNPKIHTKLEKQSKTAITFDPGRIGEAWIYGSDTLAVTLAFSAVEDIITKYSEDGDSESILESPNARLASSRLDSELHRLHAQDKEIIYDDDYSKMPDAVKRSILNWYLEDPSTSEDTSSRNVERDDTKTADDAVDHIDDVTDKFNNTKISSQSSTQKGKAADTVGYLAKPSDFVISRSSEASQPTPSLLQENSLLRETGLNHGYTEKEIDAVLTSAMGPMRTSDFLRALVSSRKLETVASDSSAGKSEKTRSDEGANTATGALMSDCSSKHPLDGFLSSGSSKLKNQSQSPKVAKDGRKQQKFEDYFTKLSQDFKEEEGEVPIEELKRRSQERQKLLLDAFMKKKSEVQGDEKVEITIKEDEEEDENDMEEIADDDKADDPDGWVKSGARPKKHKRNKKKQKSQTHAFDSVQQDRYKHASEQIFTHNYSTSPAKEFGGGFKVPNSPKKRIPHQSQGGGSNQNRFSSHSPHGKRSNSGPRNNQNRSPSPAKPMQNKQHNDAASKQHTSLQQQFNAIRKEYQKQPFQSYQQQTNMQPEYLFSTSQQPQHQQQFARPQPQQQQFARPQPQQQQFARPQPQQQQFGRPQPQHTQQRPGTKGNRNLRYIIIDGSNVAMAHGNQHVFSCLGIQICVDYFLQRGHKQITAFVPQWRSRTNQGPGHQVRDQHLLEELRENGHLVYTPARRVPGKNIVCYDDRFVIRLAKETDGIIVSNDNYRDLWYQNSEWRSIIEERLLMFSFVSDIFMPPDDPLGRDGPTLDEFLQKPDLLGNNKNTSVLTRVQPEQQRQRHTNPSRFPESGGQRTAQNTWNRGPPNSGIPPLLTPAHTQKPRPAFSHQEYQTYGASSMQYSGLTDFQAKGRMHQPNFQNTAPTQRHQIQQTQQQTHPTGATHKANKPLRSKEVTNWLAANLEKIFPDDGDKVRRILENHPFETDMNKLSGYLLEIL